MNLTRDELVDKIALIDHWGARSYGSALATARRIVDMLAREGIVAEPRVQTCPECGERVVWDEDHLPHAWRHAHDSRWCMSRPSQGIGTRYPRGATDPNRTEEKS